MATVRIGYVQYTNQRTQPFVTAPHIDGLGRQPCLHAWCEHPWEAAPTRACARAAMYLGETSSPKRRRT
jgi:hypothetical protein